MTQNNLKELRGRLNEITAKWNMSKDEEILFLIELTGLSEASVVSVLNYIDTQGAVSPEERNMFVFQVPSLNNPAETEEYDFTPESLKKFFEAETYEEKEKLCIEELDNNIKSVMSEHLSNILENEILIDIITTELAYFEIQEQLKLAELENVDFETYLSSTKIPEHVKNAFASVYGILPEEGMTLGDVYQLLRNPNDVAFEESLKSKKAEPELIQPSNN